MLKQIYLALYEKIIQIGAFKYVEMYNNQLLTQKEELPIVCPMVLIELGEFNWQTNGLHTQESDNEITFHLVFQLHQDNRNGMKTFELETMDKVQEFCEALTGWQIKDEIIRSSEFVRTKQRADNRFDQYKVHEINFLTRILDDSLNRNRRYKVPVTPDVFVVKE